MHIFTSLHCTVWGGSRVARSEEEARVEIPPPFHKTSLLNRSEQNRTELNERGAGAALARSGSPTCVKTAPP